MILARLIDEPLSLRLEIWRSFNRLSLPSRKLDDARNRFRMEIDQAKSYN